MLPFISVIMPVYNGEKFLDEAINSILNQSFTDFEFIIIDDASTDNTSELLAQFASYDKRIVLFKNKSNIGLTKSLNIALDIAKGKYIARQDADDISDSNRFQKQVEYLKQYPKIVLLGTQLYHLNKNIKEIVSVLPLKNEELRFQLANESNCFCHGSVMFNRKIALIAKKYSEKFKVAQDYEFWTRLMEYGEIANLADFLYKWRVHPNQVTCLSWNEQQKMGDDIQKKISVASFTPNITKEFALFADDNILTLFPRAKYARQFLKKWQDSYPNLNFQWYDDNNKNPIDKIEIVSLEQAQKCDYVIITADYEITKIMYRAKELFPNIPFLYASETVERCLK